MPDAFGYRAKWGLLVPGRNTVCEPELHDGAPEGITVHTARVDRKGPVVWADDQSQAAMAQAIRDAEPAAIERVLLAEPDYLLSGVGGFSVPRSEHEAIAERYERLSGLRVATSARAFLRALEVLGVQRLAILTPRLPDSGTVSGGFWEEAGYRVVAARGMGCTSARDIGNVTAEQLMAAIEELAASPAEVIMATGSDFPLMRLVEPAEERFGKPVLHLNSLLLWYALRDSGFDDRLDGLGLLLREH